MGKVIIVNTLMSSLYVYRIVVLTDLSPKQISKIYKCIKQFIWKGKKSKLKLELLQNPKEYGGLKLVNMDAKQTAIKISQIPKIINRDMSYVYNWLIPKAKHLIWEFNLAPEHVEVLIPVESHWRFVLKSWCKYHFWESFSGEDVCSEILWFNSNVCLAKKPINNYCCLEKRSRYFGDLLDENGTKMDYLKIVQKYGNNLSWLQYIQVISSSPEVWRYLTTNSITGQSTHAVLDKLMAHRSCSQMVYNNIIETNALNIVYEKFIAFNNMLQDNDMRCYKTNSPFGKLFDITSKNVHLSL